MGDRQERVGQGQDEMGRLPQAVEQPEAQGSKELVVSLHMHEQVRPSRTMPKEPVPDLIRSGRRFLEEIMLKQRPGKQETWSVATDRREVVTL